MLECRCVRKEMLRDRSDRGNIESSRFFLPILRWIGYGNYEKKMEKNT